MRILINSKLAQLLFFLVVSIMYYLPAWRYGMIHDFLGWIVKYQKGDWSDVISGFGYFGLHPVFHFFNYSLFKICGLSHLAWAISFALIQGYISYLLFRFSQRFLSEFEVPHYMSIAFVSSLLFLLGPYQVEVVTWKACLHYMMTVMFFLFIVKLMFKVMIEGARPVNIVAHHLLLIASLLTLEINLATPFILLIFAFMLSTRPQWSWKSYFLRFFSIHMMIVIFYFLANKVLLGDWVGHYGAELHFNFDASLLYNNGVSYFLKYSGLVHFWSFGTKQTIYEFIKTPVGMAGVGGILLVSMTYALRSLKKDVHVMLSSGFLVCFFMALFPIANLYFMYIVGFQNDRYGYFGSLFFYLFIITLIYRFPRIIKYPLVCLILGANLVFSYKTVMNCKQAGIIAHSLTESYRWYNDPHVRLLTIPDNYKGVYLFADFHEGSAETFIEALEVYGSEPLQSEIQEYSHFIQAAHSDSFRLRQERDTFWLEFQQYGNWFLKDGIGFIDYESDEVKATRAKNILRVELKDTSERVYLIPQAGEWKQVYLR